MKPKHFVPQRVEETSREPESTQDEATPTLQEAFRIHEGNLQSALQRMEMNYAQLERTQRQLRSIIDASPDAILLLSPDGRPMKVNTRFSDFFGLDDATVLSQEPEQLMVLLKDLFESSDKFDLLQICSSSDGDLSFREPLVQVTPTRREFDLFSLPVINIDRTAISRLYIWHDMTHDREVDRMKSTLASMVTHELRSPLTSINGFVDLLLMEDTAANLTKEQHEFLTIVQQETQRMLSLTRDLLDLSHLESGTFEWSRESFNLNHLIEKLTSSFQLHWETRRQTFTSHLPVQAPIVLGDANRVRQILTNLLSNAHKYTPDGGSIDLSVASMGSMASTAIADTGVGLSQEEQACLFTRFYRAHNPMTKTVDGTGLGLAITRMLVEMQGGEIYVDSVPNQGSTFRFTLPLVPVNAPAR